jgi:hypothetical protein
MLRNSVPPLLLGSVVAAAEVILSKNALFATCCFSLLLMAAVASLRQAARLAHWANSKTLEISFWIEDLREGFREGNAGTTHIAALTTWEPGVGWAQRRNAGLSLGDRPL